MNIFRENSTYLPTNFVHFKFAGRIGLLAWKTN